MSKTFTLTLVGVFLIFIFLICFLVSRGSQSSSAQKTEKIQNRLPTSQAIQIDSNLLPNNDFSRSNDGNATGQFTRSRNSGTSNESPMVGSTRNEFLPSPRSQSLPSRQEIQNGLHTNAATYQKALTNKASESNLYPSSLAQIWEIDEGLALPLVLSGKPPSRTAAMIAANEAIAKKFEQDITLGQEAASEVLVTDEVWVNARSNADGIFKILYGDAAYNARGMEAASSGIKK